MLNMFTEYEITALIDTDPNESKVDSQPLNLNIFFTIRA